MFHIENIITLVQKAHPVKETSGRNTENSKLGFLSNWIKMGLGLQWVSDLRLHFIDRVSRECVEW
jgi:hypothetical protein